MRATSGRDVAGLRWWMWLGLAALAGYLVHGWWQAKLDVWELPLLLVLAGLCLLPMLRWLNAGMPHLPLGEGFAFMHLIYYVNPCLGLQEDLADYTWAFRAKTLLVLILYLAVFNLIYGRLTRRTNRRLTFENTLRREIASTAIWGLFGIWVALMLAQRYDLLPYFGSARNVFNASVGAMGSIGIVCIFYRGGKGIYRPYQMAIGMVGLGLGVAANWITGSLINGACILGAGLLAYMLGRKRVPVLAMVVGLILIGFLQMGKAGYRAALMNEKSGYVEVPTSLYQAYSLWFRISWDTLTVPKEESEKNANLFARTSLIQVLAVAMDTVPHKLPYMFGKTYGMIPELLVPRVFWPDKMRGTWPTECMGVYIGIQTEGGTDTTGIAIGPPAEGWLNFGWAGLVLEGILFGVFFGLPAALTRRLEPYNIGWLMCCVFLVACVDMEHSFPEMFCSTLGGFLVGFVLLLAISTKPQLRRKSNSAGLKPNIPGESGPI